MTPKTWSLMALLAAVVLMTGCEDKRVTAFEQRISRLEQSVNSMQAEQKKIAEHEINARFNLEMCVNAANEEFERSVRSNGTKSRGGYDVPTVVLAELRRQKQDKIEDCKLLHGR